MSDEVPEKKFEGFDRVFPLIGGHHRYQWLLLMVTSLQGILAFHHMGYAFLGAVPSHWCEVEDLKENVNWTLEQIKNISIPRETKSNGDVRYEECTYYDLNYDQLKQVSSFEDAFSSIDFSNVEKKFCSNWVYDQSIYKSTTVSQFNLVCDRKYLVATIQATYMGGVFVGSLVLGALSDRILGRRGSTLISTCLVIIAGFGATFASSYSVFVMFRFIIAIGVAGSFQNCFTVLLEYSDTSYRSILGFIQQVPFAVCYMIMPLYAYYLRDWADLQLAFAVSTLALLSYYWILPESSRWLASKNREEEALKILENIAKVNKFPKPHKMEMMVILEACRSQKDRSEDGDDDERNAVTCLSKSFRGFKLVCINYVNLVRTPELRRRSFIIWFLFMVVTLVYYGISFASPSLSDDPFILVFLGGLMEVPGYIGAIPLASMWGRKPTVASTFIVAGISCGAVGFIPFDYNWLRVTCSMVGKLFISGCFAVIYLLGAELYPTSERATGLGSAVLMGRFGSIAAPYIVTMKSVYNDLPTIVFGLAALLAGLVALLLPETKGEEMLEHVKAVEQVAVRIRSASQHADEIKAALRRSSKIRRDSLKLNENQYGSRKNSLKGNESGTDNNI